jgi:hypothetical protein
MNHRKSEYPAVMVRSHLEAHHPKCPPEIIEVIVARVAGRTWNPLVSVGEAVEIVADGYIRHKLTDYERLLNLHRLTREEARQVVNPEVNAIVASWRRNVA